MTRLAWLYRRNRARHATFVAWNRYRQNPTTAARHAYQRALKQFERLELGRP